MRANVQSLICPHHLRYGLSRVVCSQLIKCRDHHPSPAVNCWILPVAEVLCLDPLSPGNRHELELNLIAWLIPHMVDHYI